MCCLEIMTDKLKDEARDERQKETVLNELSVLEQKLDYTLELSES